MKISNCAAAALIVFAGFHANTASSQSKPNMFTSELNIKFQSSEEKKLNNAQEMVIDADKMLSDATDKFAALTDLEKKERDSQAYSEALKILFNCSDEYKEAYNMAYSVLKNKGNEFWQKMNKVNHRASGMEKARYYEGMAMKSLNRALIRRQQALESDRFEYTVGIMTDALKLEKMAVRDQGRSLQICTDYPVEYNYGWEDDKTLEQIVAIMRDPNVHEPPTDIFATVDKEVKIDSALLKEIVFKVQIAAHTVPLTEEYLNTVYKGNIKIDMIFEEDWYKYSIGRYKTFDDAEATRIESNIKKAFVVSYQEGKKISTQEAVEILEKKNEILPE